MRKRQENGKKTTQIHNKMTHIQQNNTTVSDYNKNDDNKITHNNTTK